MFSKVVFCKGQKVVYYEFVVLGNDLNEWTIPDYLILLTLNYFPELELLDDLNKCITIEHGDHR